MKIFKNVRGTMDNVATLEVNTDTVYVRSNIVAINEEDFKGWQYDEIQYNKDSYIELISEKNKELEKDLMVSNMEVFNLVQAIDNENKIAQSEMMMEIFNMISQIQGGV